MWVLRVYFSNLQKSTQISEDNDVAHLLYRHCTDIEYVKLFKHKRNKFFFLLAVIFCLFSFSHLQNH